MMSLLNPCTPDRGPPGDKRKPKWANAGPPSSMSFEIRGRGKWPLKTGKHHFFIFPFYPSGFCTLLENSLIPMLRCTLLNREMKWKSRIIQHLKICRPQTLCRPFSWQNLPCLRNASILGDLRKCFKNIQKAPFEMQIWIFLIQPIFGCFSTLLPR